MKELSIEQKAKAYDEALKAAIAAHKDEDRHLKATLERIFPELKESEDEKIRKEILHFIKKRDRSGCDYDYDKWIAWLEKQGKKETLCDKCRKEHPSHSCQDITALGRCALEKQDEQKQKQYDIDILEKHITKDSISELAHTVIVRNGWEIVDAKEQKTAWNEKQGDEKIVDKAEPKFKVGDWIIDGKNIAQITSITCDGIIETTFNKNSNIEVIEPIPLTSTILEKNGFTLKEGEKGMYGVTIAPYYTRNDVPFEVFCDGDPFAIWFKDPVNIKYVHQLQHALRLCGIEKEIIL